MVCRRYRILRIACRLLLVRNINKTKLITVSQSKNLGIIDTIKFWLVFCFMILGTITCLKFTSCYLEGKAARITTFIQPGFCLRSLFSKIIIVNCCYVELMYAMILFSVLLFSFGIHPY